MHSVGGLEAARSVSGALQLLGCLLPPLGTMSLSHVAQSALAQSDHEDIWRPSDLGPLVKNLLFAAQMDREGWAAWPVARTEVSRGRFPGAGSLDVDEAPWLSVDD